MVQLSQRNQMLQDLGLNESIMEQMARLDHAEASWRIEHEYKEHCKWAKRRRDFMQAEIDELLPKKPRPKPPKNTPPIVSHRSGIGRTGGGKGGAVFGERYG
jgi:hypothetical protein